MSPSAGAPRTAVVSAGVAVVALVGGWTWAADLVGAGFDPRVGSISALASLETPHRWVMTSALVLTGLAHCVTAAALARARTPGRITLAVGGAATLGVAAFPLPARDGSSGAHLAAATVSFAALALWPLLAARPVPGPAAWPPVAAPLSRRVAWPAGAVLVLAVLSLGVGIDGAAFGLHERVVATLTVLWPLVTAVGVWWSAGHRIGSRRVRHVLAAGLLTIGCSIAGIAATTAAPVTAQTRDYRASVSLDADLRHVGDLRAETTLGTLRVSFDGVAPGVHVVPQVKADIADTLARPGVSLATLRPGPEELDTAVREVGARIAVRFALGALLFAGTVLGVWALARRAPPPGWLVSVAVIAWATATVTTTASVYTTYQPERQRTFGAGELLGTLQRNAGLLDDVEARATEAAPYLRNLLALSTALQQKYAAGALESDPALRVVLISDVHGGNQYTLLRTIIEQESIDLVLDTGDLLNFGTVAEGEAAGLFAGIESLGVPYLFVRGNHDATSATDTALLRRMAQIPGVALLQTPDGEYQTVTAAGITFAGFNDPRYFGDDGTDQRGKNRPAREAFLDAFADADTPDVVMSHEPWALDGVRARILLNGHMHAPDVEGNRIQAGTFTGGGPFTHFIGGRGGAELQGQPSSFSVLTFGTDCRLSSLTRYRFRDVIEGRPAYDDVSIVNGNRIEANGVAPARTCAPGGAVTTRPASVSAR